MPYPSKKTIVIGLLFSLALTASALYYSYETSKDLVVYSEVQQSLTMKEKSQLSSVNSITRGIKSLNKLLIQENKVYNISIETIKQHISNLARNHKEALRHLIVHFEENTKNNVLQDEILDILSHLKSTEVKKLGLRLMQSSNTSKMIDGLDLLFILHIENEEILMRTLDIIEHNQENYTLILSAIRLMPIIPVSEEKRLNIVKQYSRLSTHTNTDIRFASFIALSKWAKNTSELTPLLLTLEGTDTEDRISAITALHKSAIVSPQIKDILISYMLDKSELWEIRLLSSHTLERFDLNDTQSRQYRSFKQSQLSLNK